MEGKCGIEFLENTFFAFESLIGEMIEGGDCANTKEIIPDSQEGLSLMILLGAKSCCRGRNRKIPFSLFKREGMTREEEVNRGVVILRAAQKYAQSAMGKDVGYLTGRILFDSCMYDVHMLPNSPVLVAGCNVEVSPAYFVKIPESKISELEAAAQTGEESLVEVVNGAAQLI